MEFPGGLVVKDSVLSLLWLGGLPGLELPHAVGAAKKKRRERNKGSVGLRERRRERMLDWILNCLMLQGQQNPNLGVIFSIIIF